MRTFTQVLADLPGGRTVDELSEQLAAVVLAVAKANKKGSLTLTLEILPNADNMVVIRDQIKTKVPLLDRGTAHFYFDEEGSLLKDNPKQGKLPLRAVETASKEPPRRIPTAARSSLADELDGAEGVANAN